MNRRQFLQATTASILAASIRTKRTQAQQKPNIIVIMCEDMGYGDAAAFGHPYLQTPNIDRLVNEGVRFTQGYAMSPVCSPSKAAILTGMFPHSIGVHGTMSGNRDKNAARSTPDYLDPTIPTLPRILQSAGYTTGHFGKWHMGYIQESPSVSDYGFDVHRTVSSAREYWNRGDYRNFQAQSTDLFVDEAISFVDDTDGPFYLNLWSRMPHTPVTPWQADIDVYSHVDADPNDFTGHMKEYLEQMQEPDAHTGGEITERMRVYCAAVTGFDRAIGRLLDHLDSTGLASNTIVVFTSDHGPEGAGKRADSPGMGSTGGFRKRKRSLYEGGIRVPLVIRWPDALQHRTDNDTIIGGVDFLPTLCSLAGVPSSVTVDGNDMSDGVLHGNGTRITPLMWEWRTEWTPEQEDASWVIRDGRWKLHVKKNGEIELYNLEGDPEERNNRVNARPGVTERLSLAALPWMAKTGIEPLAAVGPVLFTARYAGENVEFIWEVTEIGNAGFNLYAGNEKINSELIPSSVIDSLEPTRYGYVSRKWWDSETYMLELIDVQGVSSKFGPTTAPIYFPNVTT